MIRFLLVILKKRMNCTRYYPLILKILAFGSIRMEPVFMVLGESAGTIASLAIDENKAVQELEYAQIRKKLIEQKQVLE